VDHSIFFYLMDPEGQFVDAFGRSFSKEDVREKVGRYIRDYRETAKAA
jgi:protein SCO1/2